MVTLPEKECVNHPSHDPSQKFTGNANVGCTVKVGVHAQITDERATIEQQHSRESYEKTNNKQTNKQNSVAQA